MLGDHVLLEQMMVGYLLSDMGSCLQVFQHHTDIKGQMLWVVFVDLWKQVLSVLEKAVLRPGNQQETSLLGEMTWQLERGRRRVCWQPLAPTESSLRQDKAAADAKWAEY